MIAPQSLPDEIPMTPEIKTLAVLGAGTMGHGIAGQAARFGCTVVLNDIDEARVQKGLDAVRATFRTAVDKGKMTSDEAAASLDRLRGEVSVEAAVASADLVVEAVPEQMPLKRALFERVEAAAPAHALLGTNTSSLSITEIASATKTPARVVGLHFFNPVAVMPLLEIVRGEHTSDAVVAAARAFGERIQKTCIVVRDSPGFATSRLGIALGNEAMRMFEEGVASAEDIDKAMVLGYRHPIGPLALTDLVGLDVRLAISEHLHRELGTDTFRPPQVLRRMVRAGKLGKKTGEGFYKY
jgi:3-hydroxybutyryl-CoA dehydrogenase